MQLADVLRRHGPSYLQRYGDAVPISHVRAIEAVTRCRTAALGGQLAKCTVCDREHLLFHSCRHRICPTCGFDATNRWLARQRELVLPVPYFHVVFTLPAELRRLVRSHQRALLGVLFRAAFDSLAALCRSERWLGGNIGALAVLHTWTRTLEWHPHVHLLVPAGGLAGDGQTWVRPPRCRKRFLVPVRALAAGFRGRFLHLARKALPAEAMPQVDANKRWVVYSKPVAHGPEQVLEYLGRYVHRTALSDKSILACDTDCVRFAYRDSRDGQRKTMRLPAHEFVRRFLQHVPRKGLHRVRTFGLLHPAYRPTLRRLQLKLAPPPVLPQDAEPRPEVPVAIACPHCKHRTLQRRRRLSAEQCHAWLQRASAHPVPAHARAPPSMLQGAEAR